MLSPSEELTVTTPGTQAERVCRYLVIHNNRSVLILLLSFRSGIRIFLVSKEISDNSDLPDIVLREVGFPQC